MKIKKFVCCEGRDLSFKLRKVLSLWSFPAKGQPDCHNSDYLTVNATEITVT